MLPLRSPSCRRMDATLAVVNPNSSHDLVAVDPDGDGWDRACCAESRTSGGGACRSTEPWPTVTAAAASSAKVVVRDSDGGERVVTPPGEGWPARRSPRTDAGCVLAESIPGRDGISGDFLRGRASGHAGDGRRGTRVPVVVSRRSIRGVRGRDTDPGVGGVGAGGAPRLLTPDGGDYPEWSPNGAWIAYVVWTDESDVDQGAWVVDAGGGVPVKIADDRHAIAVESAIGASCTASSRVDRLELWQCRPGIGTGPARGARRRDPTVDSRTLPSAHGRSGDGDLIMNRRPAPTYWRCLKESISDRW